MTREIRLLDLAELLNKEKVDAIKPLKSNNTSALGTKNEYVRNNLSFTPAHLFSCCLRSTATPYFLVVGWQLVATPVKYNHYSIENISTSS